MPSGSPGAAARQDGSVSAVWDENNLPPALLALLDTETARRYYPREVLARILNVYDSLPDLTIKACEHCRKPIVKNPFLKHDPKMHPWVHQDTGMIPCFRWETALQAIPAQTRLQDTGD